MSNEATREAQKADAAVSGSGSSSTSGTGTGSAGASSGFKRTYTWDEKGRLTATSDSNYDVEYVYGEDNQRAVKTSDMGETLYFNNFWTWSNNTAPYNGSRTAKHIFLNNERIVTKLNSANNPTYSEESASTYYYHSDHLGSASLITDNDGREYESIEYTPYGEVWIDKASATFKTSYRFTGKERDEETGLYYFGERYLDAKVSRWLSCDPALGEYMAGTSAGCGGIFNSVNLNLYHYGGNNAPRYVDPDGRMDITSYYIPDFCSFVKGTDNKLAVPLGGGLTSTQKDISKIQDLITLGFSLIPDAGNFAMITGSGFSIDTVISLTETIVGMLSDTAGMSMPFVDLLNIIASDPEISAKNYSKDQIDFIGKCSTEQLFIKDYSDALTKKGISNSKTLQGTFIMNLEIYDVPLFSDELIQTAQEVKDSKPLYKDVVINY